MNQDKIQKEASPKQMKEGWICLPIKELEGYKQKARTWDKLYGECKVSAQIRGVFGQKNTPLSHMDELLAQSNIPPEAGKGD